MRDRGIALSRACAPGPVLDPERALGGNSLDRQAPEIGALADVLNLRGEGASALEVAPLVEQCEHAHL
jgi:hypothetical protein